ncbi:histamine H2 receptor-like [Oculina patagonica]
MASQIDDFEALLSQCPDIHAQFDFEAMKKLNDTSSVLPFLLGNVSICLKHLEDAKTDALTEWTTVATTVSSYQLPVLVTYFVLVAVLGLCVNLCVIGTICRVRRLWTITNAFVLSLAMADFFMASVLVPLNIWSKYHPDQGTAKDTLFPLLGVASLLNLAAVTLERFLSISYPLTYDVYLNRFRATIIIASVWLVSIFQALLQFAFKNESRKTKTLYEDLRFAFAFGLPCLCILVVNVKIYCVARQHARQINAANPQNQNASGGSSRAFLKKLKTVKVIALLVGTFVVTWLPYFSLSIYEHHTAYGQTTEGFDVALQVAEALACGTALFNPLLYGLLRKDVREAMVRGLKCQNVNQTDLQSVSYSFRTEPNTTKVR